MKKNKEGNYWTLCDIQCLHPYTKNKAIKVIFTQSAKDVSSEQNMVFDDLPNIILKFLPKILRQSVDEWNRLLKENADEYPELSELQENSNLENILFIDCLYIHNDFHVNGYTTIGLAGGWDIDEEHGWGCLIRNDEIEIDDASKAFCDISDYFSYNSKSELLILYNELIDSMEHSKKIMPGIPRDNPLGLKRYQAYVNELKDLEMMKKKYEKLLAKMD